MLNYNNNNGYGGYNPNMQGGFNPFAVNQNDKQEITHDCFRLGILLIIYEFLQNFLGKAFYYVVYTIREKKLAFSWNFIVKYYRAHPKLLTSTSFSMTMNISVTLIALIIMFLVAKFGFHMGVKGYLKADRKKVGTAFKWFSGCYLTNLLFTYFGSFLIIFFNSSGINVPQNDMSIRSPSAIALTVQFAYAVILAPLFEELIFRGLILNTLSKYSKRTAVLVSALAFALMHGNVPQAVSAFGTGLLYAIIAVNSGSIVPTIIIHMLNNLFASWDDFAKVLNIPQYELIQSISMILVAIAGLYVFCTMLKQLRVERVGYKSLDYRQTNRIILTNPVIICYFLYFLYYIVSAFITYNR